jgi:hypothetical protein
VSIDGDYAIVGQPQDDDNGNASGSVFLFERQGGIWQQVVKLLASDGEGGDLLGWSVFMDHDEVFAGAATQSAGGTYSGAAYVFTDFPTEIHEERVAGFSSNPVLNQNRPNPFTSMTQLSYALARTSQVSLKVYDASGQLVYTLVDETVGPGYHVAEWHGKSESGSDAPSGIYFCRIQADDFTSTKKMILLR